MSAPRTVTVQTLDHGPVTLPEPTWCAGVHPEGVDRSDLTHVSATVETFVGTEFGGDALLISAEIVVWPFSTRSTAPYALVDFHGDQQEYGPAKLRELADALIGFAEFEIPQLIERLVAIESGDGQ